MSHRHHSKRKRSVSNSPEDTNNNNNGNNNGDIFDNLPKMKTKEKGGVISASVDETNRIRALLGLKPLNIESTSSSKDNSMKK